MAPSNKRLDEEREKEGRFTDDRCSLLILHESCIGRRGIINSFYVATGCYSC